MKNLFSKILGEIVTFLEALDSAKKSSVLKVNAFDPVSWT
jgi:hypothetical protein